MATFKRKRDELGQLTKLQTRSSSSSLSNLSGGGVKKLPSSAQSDLERAKTQERTTIGDLAAYGKTEKDATDDRNFIEKGLGLKSGQGFFSDVFETLGKPQQAIEGALLDTNNPVTGAWKGLTGQKRYTGEDLSNSMGITSKSSPQWLKSLAGFGLDMATDPLAYTNAPFKWAGTQIKGMATKGYGAAASALSQTEKGAKIVQSLESAYDRMSSVGKSAFGLWKDEGYKGVKNSILNNRNKVDVSKESIAHNAKEINDEVVSFAKDMHENPSKYTAERKALKLSPDATESEVTKAVHDDLMNAAESRKNESLSKKEVYNNLGKQVSEEGEGRFLVTGSGKESKKQADAIMKEVRADWNKANGRPLRDDELSFTNGFINAGPEVAAFLRRTTAGYDNISNRLKLFGINGRLEGAMQTLGRSGAVTFDMSDPSELELVKEISRRFGSKADVRFGAGTAAVKLNAAEFKDLMQTQEVQRIFQESKDFAKSTRNMERLSQTQERLQNRMRAINKGGSAKVAALNEDSKNIIRENIELRQNKEELTEARDSLIDEAAQNKKVISKVNGENIYAKDTKLLFTKFKGVYNDLLEQMPGLHDVIPEERFNEIATNFVAGKGSPDAQASFQYQPTRTVSKTGVEKAGVGESTLTIYMDNVNDVESAMIHELMHSIDGTLSLHGSGETALGMKFASGTEMEADERFINIGGQQVRTNAAFKSGNYYENNILNHITKDMYEHPNWWKEEIDALRADEKITRMFEGGEDISHLSNKEFMKMYKDRADKAATGEIEDIYGISDEQTRRDMMQDSGIWYDADNVDDYTLDYYQEQGKETIDEALERHDGDWDAIGAEMKAEIGDDEYNELLQGYATEGANERDVFPEFFDEESYIVGTVSDKIGSFGRALTSGPSTEYWAEIMANHLTGNFTKAASKRYERFIQNYADNVMGVDLQVGRKIKVEKAELNGELNQIRAKERFNNTKIVKNKTKREETIKQTYEEMNKLDGSAQTIAERQKEMSSKINKQTNTINRIYRETDMNLNAESTNGDLSAEMTKPSTTKTAIVIDNTGQKEIQQINAELKRWRAVNDGNFYKVKMADSVLVDISKDFEKISNSVEGVKQQIYDVIEQTYARPGTPLNEVLKNLNVDGYMRHVMNPDAMIYNEISKLRAGGKLAGARARELVGNLGDNSTFFEKNWYGSATEINQKLNVELFNTNPIESLAVLLKLLPEHFEVTNVFQSAFDSGLIRELGEEETTAIIDLVEANRNDGMVASAAKANALKQILPAEYTMVDANVKQKLINSFDFLEKGGAKGEEVEALKQQIQKIDESQGMIIHKGMLNQIHRYGKQLRNQDVRKILDVAKKYFVNPFKSLATLSIGFHARNNITNVTNAYLAGMEPGVYMKHFTGATADLTKIERAIIPKLERLVRSGREDIRTIAGQHAWIEKHFTTEEKRLYNKMHEWQSKGVMGVNRFSGDLSDIISGIDKQGTNSRLAKAYQKTTETSMKLGKLSDDASKIATYEWAKNTEEGKAILASHGMKEPEEFSKFVFFDYTDLTDFESRYMKAIFPFYTWTRKNIEFQFKNFMQNSNRYIRLNKTIKHWQTFMAGGNQDQLSSYDVEDMKIPISNSNGQITMLKVSPGFLDVSDTFKHPLNKISPLIKAPLEAWAGVNFFSGQGIDTGPFGQFGQEMFGDFGELGKGLHGQKYDSTKVGLVGSKAIAGRNAIASIAAGQPTPSSLASSVFKTSNNEDTEASNIQRRISQSKQYIQNLQASGKTPDSRLLPRNRGRSAGSGYTRAGTKYNI